MSEEVTLKGVEPVPWHSRLRRHYSGHRRIWNGVLVAISVAASVAWVDVFTNWSTSAKIWIVAAGMAWWIIEKIFDKPAAKIPAKIMQSRWWLAVPAAVSLLWIVSLAALPPIERNQVVVVPSEVLARTVEREGGWRIRVLQNDTTVCELTQYDGKMLVCGGANLDALKNAVEAVLQPYATRWKGGDRVTVRCFDPKSNSCEYECGKALFPKSAKKKSLEVTIDA